MCVEGFIDNAKDQGAIIYQSLKVTFLNFLTKTVPKTPKIKILKTYTGLVHSMGKLLSPGIHHATLYKCPFVWFKKFTPKVAQ